MSRTILVFLIFIISCNIVGKNRHYNNDFQNNNQKLYTILVNNNKNNNEIANPINCEFQNDNIINLGIGIAVWSYDCSKNIVIYSDSLLNNPVYNFYLCKNIRNYPCPLFCKIDYGIYHFIVTDFTEKWCKIIYNGNQYGYIAMDSTFEFVYWDKFLLDYSTGIREKGHDDIFKVNLIKCDTIIAINLEKNTKKNILWRKNNKLLIDFFLLD